jgi:hypothetical protein
MLGRIVLIALLAVLAAGYYAAPLLSRSAQRRRDARALRRFVVRDIEAGRRSRTEAAIADILTWCDEVARTGRDLPLADAVTDPRSGPDVIDLSGHGLSLVRDA